MYARFNIDIYPLEPAPANGERQEYGSGQGEHGWGWHVYENASPRWKGYAATAQQAWEQAQQAVQGMGAQQVAATPSPAAPAPADPSRISRLLAAGASYDDLMLTQKQEVLREALLLEQFNISRAAQRLRLHRNTFARLMRQAGIEVRGWPKSTRSLTCGYVRAGNQGVTQPVAAAPSATLHDDVSDNLSETVVDKTV